MQKFSGNGAAVFNDRSFDKSVWSPDLLGIPAMHLAAAFKVRERGGVIISERPRIRRNCCLLNYSNVCRPDDSRLPAEGRLVLTCVLFINALLYLLASLMSDELLTPRLTYTVQGFICGVQTHGELFLAFRKWKIIRSPNRRSEITKLVGDA